jgi:large subunit ribosomal protein L33
MLLEKRPAQKNLSACVAQLVEHFLGKEEVIGSIPIASSNELEEDEGTTMRDIITLECTDCKRRNYSTTKNKKKQTGRVEYKKYCPWCKKRTPHKETK